MTSNSKRIPFVLYSVAFVENSGVSRGCWPMNLYVSATNGGWRWAGGRWEIPLTSHCSLPTSIILGQRKKIPISFTSFSW